MDNINCSVIKDLLTLYIKGLTGEETRLYIENHLKDCNDCTKYLDDMSQDTNISIGLNKEDLEKNGAIIISKIKKSQDSVKYTFIIFSIMVAVSCSILSKGFISTVPLVIIVPCVLKIFFNEDRVIFITSILTQIVIAVASENLGYGLLTLPVTIFCVNGGLIAGRFIKNIIEGRL